MNYLCNCDQCICAADGADHAASPADPAASQSRYTGRAVRRRAALCTRASEASEPPIGAHLITPRRGYTHHGIYAGHGSVLHYAGLARAIRSGPVEEVPLEHFANGRPVHIECRNTPALNEEDIVIRARSRLGENRYRLLTNNCEHFSEWSRFGISRSRQVERWLGLTPSVTRGFIVKIRRRLSWLRPEDRMGGALA